MKKIFLIILVILLSSCSTLIHGTKHKFNIYSNSNKTIIIKDKYDKIVYKSNGKIEVSLNKKYSFFEPAKYLIQTDEEKIYIDYVVNKNTFVIGNLFFPIGYLIDSLNGAMYDLVIDKNIIDSIELK